MITWHKTGGKTHTVVVSAETDASFMRAHELMPNDLLDLEGDYYFDPHGDDPGWPQVLGRVIKATLSEDGNHMTVELHNGDCARIPAGYQFAVTRT